MADDSYSPGDLLLDRFFSDADAALRERARAAFLDYGRRLHALGATLCGSAAGPTHSGPRAGAHGILTEATSPP